MYVILYNLDSWKSLTILLDQLMKGYLHVQYVTQ